MRKPLALISALLVMLLSLVPFMAPPLVAPPLVTRGMAQTMGAVVAIRDAETESCLRGIAHPLFRAAGVDAGLVRITPIQARAINAFVTSGNRMFIHMGLIQQVDGVGKPVGALAQEAGMLRGRADPRLGEVPAAQAALPPGPRKLRAQDCAMRHNAIT